MREQADQDPEKFFDDPFYTLMDKILTKVALKTSMELGLLKNVEKLKVIADGSLVSTQANRRGTKCCDCSHGEKCRCERYYSDPDATFGRKNPENTVFGYNFHLLTTKNGEYDLPLNVIVKPAHTSDASMAFESVMRLLQQFKDLDPKAAIDTFIADKGYDFYDLYKFLVDRDIRPVIPIRSNANTLQKYEDIEFNKDGIPLCPGGIPYHFLHVDHKKHCDVFNCPIKVVLRKTISKGKRKSYISVKLEQCPLGALCKPNSQLGPYLRIPHSDNPRISPPIPRHSKLFKDLYAQRTAAERFFALLKHGNTDWRPCRRMHILQIQGIALAITIHAKAWLKTIFKGKQIKDIFEGISLIKEIMQNRINNTS